ncbi:beta-glucanase (GH16 family) [Prauserella shujinwangii]|uniref:Beta-glucanase (GH16 family) n=1 Tax=Prauserella shujinwangii TaxID=1453103 RepID=A0A2T0M0P1_9PSEU|nr:glycoside hydrolase family 16 protein [Prauserella shujinwangii]PRX50151.1 beta-glucanase (GH16 family) [Prauserella shujinwangii]
MSRPARALVAGLAALAAAVVPGPATAEPTPGGGMNAAATTFFDDFEGPAGAPVDSAKWRHEIGNGNEGWGNLERQYYTDGTDNAALDGDGNLVITAREENPAGYQCWYGSCWYTSAKFSTAQTFTQAYGHFEARMKLPEGRGIWPAFWMLGADFGDVGWPDSGEIDIMENVGHEPGTVHGTLHGPGYSGPDGIGAAYTLPGGERFSDGFHTFAVDWSPQRIQWSVDGNVYQVRTPADLGGDEWVFDHPFYLILNLAVGGRWPGDPDGSTSFPQQLVIDYVRVTDGATSGGGQPIVGLADKCVDVAGASTDNGTPVQLYECNGTAAQRWTFAADGSVRALGKCLDVAGAGTADGTPVQLYECNGTAAQQWVHTAAGDIVNPHADKCLDVTGADSADGTRLQIWTCAGTANQKWRV